MDKTKRIAVICLHPDGQIDLEQVNLILTWAKSLGIPHVNASQGPEFVQSPYTYVLHHNTGSKDQENIYSEVLLHAECGCGYEEHDTCNGKMYVVKHDPRKGKDHKFDYKKDIPFEEVLEYDTHVSCQIEDVEFIRTQLEVARIRYRVRVSSWTEWFLYQVGWKKF